MPLVQQLTFARPTTLGFDDPSALDELKRKELQALAKKHGIRANMKSVDIVTALKDLYESEQQRLNAEHEAAALAASGLPTATADISVITEASFVDVPASPSAGSAANDSDDDDAASTGDICAAVERAEGTATAAEPIASPAQQPVAVEAAAAPMQAAPASTKKARGSARRPVSAASQRRKSRGSAAAATKNTRAAATFKAASKVKAPEDRPTKLAMPKKRVTKNWDQIHSKLFANQESISQHMNRRKTPKRKSTPVKTFTSAKKATPKSAAATLPRKTPVEVPVLKKKPFVPAKSSKKPTTARAPKLGVVRAATPAASNGGAGAGTSSGAAPTSAQQAATKIPVRKHVAPKRRRPTPHPFAQATKSRLPTPHRDRATAAQAKAGGKAYNAYRGKVAYSGDSLFSPKKVAQPRKKFDLKASLAKGLSYKPHTGKLDTKQENTAAVANRTAKKTADKSKARAATFKARTGVTTTKGRQAKFAARGNRARAAKLAARRGGVAVAH